MAYYINKLILLVIINRDILIISIPNKTDGKYHIEISSFCHQSKFSSLRLLIKTNKIFEIFHLITFVIDDNNSQVLHY